MTAQTTNQSLIDTAPGGWKTRIGHFLTVLSNTSRFARASQRAQYLYSLSDRQLAEMGLSRDRIAQHVFGGLLYI